MTFDFNLSRRGFLSNTRNGIAVPLVLGAAGAGTAVRAAQSVPAAGPAGDDHDRLEKMIAGDGGREVRLPPGSYLSRSALTPAADAMITGEGARSIIATDRASDPVFSVKANGVAIRNLKIEGGTGSGGLKNSAVGADHADRMVIAHVEASGMSGSAFLLTGQTTRALLSRLYVHGLTGSVPNASDVMLYGGAAKNIVRDSVLGGGRAVGVYCQINSTQHKIVFNYVGPQSAYGIMDYDIAPRATYTLILGNSIEEISGAEPIQGRAIGGAGIYTADTGGQIIAHNHVTGANAATREESLVPAGIAINAVHSPAPTLLIGNYPHHNRWYGIMLMRNVQASPVIGNVIFENARDQLYFKESAHAMAIGNAITALSMPASQDRCVSINVVGPRQTGALVAGNRTRGGSLAAIDIWHTDQNVVTANNISDCKGRGLQLVGSANQVVSGNMVDVSDGTGVALNLVDVMYSSLSAMVLRIGERASVALATSGTCTGTRIDRSVLLSDKPNPMDFIHNAGTGCIVEQWGIAPPTRLAHQPGDTVWNAAPKAGAPIGWKCIVAGTPGSWAPMHWL